jgi:hypothetical protein
MNGLFPSVAISTAALALIGTPIGSLGRAQAAHGHFPRYHHHPAAHECVPKVEQKVIKKTVFEVRCVPVCEHKPTTFLHCDCCPVCQLHYKKVLVKREIEVGTECVVVCEPVARCGCARCAESLPAAAPVPAPPDTDLSVPPQPAPPLSPEPPPLPALSR